MALRALIIANGSFDDANISPLKSPVSDASRLQALLARGDVGPYDVKVCADLESHELRRAVEQFFSQAGYDDRQLLFFSGHGFKHGPDSRLYFGSKDTTRASMRSSSLSARFVFEEASLSVAQQTLIFIDCCYSGAFVKGHMIKASDQVVARDDFEVDNAHGMAIITASSSVQTAAEVVVDDYSQSIFTRHLIEGIESGSADLGQSGQITLDGLFRHIRSAMRKDAPGQEPKPHYFGLDGTVEVAKNPVRKPIEPPKPSLPKKLTRRIASSNFNTRRLACAELYHHADGNPDAVNLVRDELTGLTRDPHDFVKEEARHQLSRLGERFAASEPLPPKGEIEVEPHFEPIAVVAPPPPQTETSPAEIDMVESASAKPPPERPEPFAVIPPRKISDAEVQRRKRIFFITACAMLAIPIIIIFFIALDDFRSQPPEPATEEAAADSALEDAAGPAEAGLPGEWLIGQWVINQSPSRGCGEQFSVARGRSAMELQFRDPLAQNQEGEYDTIRSESATVLVTSGWRYSLNASTGTVRMQSLSDPRVTQELSRCAAQ